jgi:hypothetical protein
MICDDVAMNCAGVDEAEDECMVMDKEINTHRDIPSATENESFPIKISYRRLKDFNAEVESVHSQATQALEASTGAFLQLFSHFNELLQPCGSQGTSIPFLLIGA